MDTKLNPNPNSCFFRAMPDEERFTLLARDLEAPKAIRHWVTLRIESGQPADDPQLLDSLTTANAMEQWRATHDGEWRGYRGHEPDLTPTPSDEISGIAGQILGTKPHTPNGAATLLESQFNQLLTDAKRLAGFVMRSDREAGHNS